MTMQIKQPPPVWMAHVMPNPSIHWGRVLAGRPGTTPAVGRVRLLQVKSWASGEARREAERRRGAWEMGRRRWSREVVWI